MPMTFDSLHLGKLLLSLLCCLSLLACQPADIPPIIETPAVQAQMSAKVDLNDLCNNLATQMQAVHSQRTVLALQEMNKDLTVCLPLMETEQQFQLLNLSTQMYQQFFAIQRSPEQQAAFEDYVSGAGAHPTLQQSHFEHMHLRDQYLVKHQGQAYLEVIHWSDQHTTYRRHPQYLARIFAPYLPEAEQSFIVALANQNTSPLLRDGRLQVEPMVLADRALFWEKYLAKYPQSRYFRDAQYLYQAYSQLLFIGFEDRQVLQYDQGSTSVDGSTLAAVQYLAQQPRSQLTRQAQLFLDFLEQHSTAPLENLAAQQQQAVRALRQHLNLTQVSFNRRINCFQDAVCLR
jgi:hypothetical protein